MISRLRGTVLSVKPPVAVIDVGGVGFRVSCSQAALDTLDTGRTADLHTHLIVREDDLSLFGFSSEEEVTLFLTLLTVAGIGPRTALSILSRLQPEALRAAIVNNRVDVISQVPGIGKKSAKNHFCLEGQTRRPECSAILAHECGRCRGDQRTHFTRLQHHRGAIRSGITAAW